MNILIIGGTRNLGHLLTWRLLEAGHQVTIFNRGQTPDTLPDAVERLRGDRSDRTQLRAALKGRAFDVVVDTTLYNGPDAEAVVDLLAGRVGHYIFVSTGQVYLVCLNLARPFKEDDYAGPVMAAPAAETYDYISQDETLPLETFLALLADTANRPLRIARVAPEILAAHNLMPACSPFSDSWMSELDNRRSKQVLGLTYTPVPLYLQKLVAHYQAATQAQVIPESYRRRDEELRLV